jgi:hypothetical protein
MDVDPPGNGSNNGDESGENGAEETLQDAPARSYQAPLFLAGTPSPARSMRATQNGAAGNQNTSSPLRNVAARRALGLSTPKNPTGARAGRASLPKAEYNEVIIPMLKILSRLLWLTPPRVLKDQRQHLPLVTNALSSTVVPKHPGDRMVDYSFLLRE